MKKYCFHFSWEAFMKMMRENWSRRGFLSLLAMTGSRLATPAVWGAEGGRKPASAKPLKLGFDNFSVRAFGWKAPQLIECAERLGLDVVLISDLEAYDSLEEDYLKRVKELADRAGVELQAGTGSICPTSSSFNPKHGSAEEHLALVIRVAKALGSPVARCFLGSNRDREKGEIYRHIESTVKVCQAQKSLAQDAGVTIAIENHAGDMQAWELRELVEAAGKDYVGVTLDPGNAAWSMEDPMVNLEILGPYAVTSGMRDSMVYETDDGAVVQWTCMGDGLTDWTAYLEKYAELSHQAPFVLEVIANVWDRPLPYLTAEFWDAYPRAKASEFARFVKLAKCGKPYQAPAERPTGEKSRELEQAQQMYDLERSVRYCKEVLGLGLK
jgi:sugar phosphate isomerase/epimerase